MRWRSASSSSIVQTDKVRTWRSNCLRLGTSRGAWSETGQTVPVGNVIGRIAAPRRAGETSYPANPRTRACGAGAGQRPIKLAGDIFFRATESGIFFPTLTNGS